MSDAPERIWATHDLRNGYYFTASGPQLRFEDVEYVRADRIEDLEAILWAADYDAQEAEAYAAELEKRNASLETLIKDFFLLLDKTEETDEGRVFRPNHINSCRAEDGQKLENLLRLMKATVEGRW